MNTTRTWTLALLAGLFGAGDWFLATLPADEKALQEPVLTVGNAVVTAAVRDVDNGGKKEQHLFLDLKGEGAGTVKVRLSSITINPMARMMPRPKTLWEKDLAVDTTKARSIDIGGLPDDKSASLPRGRVLSEGGVSYTLAASIDGKTFVSLLAIPPRQVRFNPPPIKHLEM